MLTKLQNQPLKSTKRKRFKSCMIPISNSFVHDKAPSLRALAPLGITGVVGNSGRACLGLLALFLANFAFCHAVFAESVSISVSNASQSFDLAPGTSSAFGKSGDITASITTDYAYGYDFTVSGPDDSGELKGATGHLSSISSAITETDFKTSTDASYNNKWGFLPSKVNSTTNTEYQPSPKKTTPTPIDVTTAANPDPNNYTFAIAARVDNTVPKETYSSDFTLAAVANYAYFGIGFADVTNGMPAIIHGLTNNGNVTFTAPAAPTKTGYTFKGWCGVETGNNGSCSGTTYDAGTEYTISLSSNFVNTYTTLYARWEPIATFESVFQEYGKSKYNGTNYYAMQDMTPGICSAVSISGEESATQLIDTRDNNVYTIAKLVDGKCWLLDNLRLVNTTKDLSSDDTNVPAAGWSGFDDAGSKTLPAPSTDGFANSAANYRTTLINNRKLGFRQTDDELGDDVTSWDFGVFYNFAAASAGTVRLAAGSGVPNAQYDICPKGWRLPTGGPDGEYQGLYIALGGEYTNERTRTVRIETRKALHIPRSGFSNGDNAAFYGWSSTVKDGGSNAYVFVLDGIGVNPQYNHYRFLGFSIRCIAK